MPAMTLCPECGSAPGECYNICPLSPYCYTLEMEMRDEANWSPADSLRETYGGDIDSEKECRYAAMDDAEAEGREYVAVCVAADFGCTPAIDDCIPF